MKFSFPTKAEFCDTLKAAPQKVGYAASKEITALKQDPLKYAATGFIRYGRAIGGLLWIWGDKQLLSAHDESALVQFAGCISGPMTSIFLLEPWLGRKFGINKEKQPVVPVGSYKINTTKLGYKGFALTTSLLLVDAFLHMKPHEMMDLLHNAQEGFKHLTPEAKKAAGALFQAGASGVATVGSLQAGWKSKDDLVVVKPEDIVEPDKKEGSLWKQCRKDQEIAGVSKLVMENGFMITSAVLLGRPEMLATYLRWCGGNICIITRRAMEIFHENKKDKAAKPDPVNQNVPVLPAEELKI